jgi:hypothetical protein
MACTLESRIKCGLQLKDWPAHLTLFVTLDGGTSYGVNEKYIEAGVHWEGNVITVSINGPDYRVVDCNWIIQCVHNCIDIREAQLQRANFVAAEGGDGVPPWGECGLFAQQDIRRNLC